MVLGANRNFSNFLLLPILLLELGAFLAKRASLLWLVAVFLLYLGVSMTTYAWSYLFDYAAMRGHGAQETAQIINTERHETRDGVGSGGVSHAIALSWHDEAGMTRQFGCIVVSERFWKRISAGERLAVYQIPIWYLEDEPSARP